MLSFCRSLIAGVAFLCCVLAVAPATAQMRSPADLLAAYVGERQTPMSKPGTTRASNELIHVLTSPTDYRAGDMESLVRGLEQLALTGSPPRLRAEAAFALSIPGSRGAAQSISGTFARLKRVYDSSSDPLVRSVLVGVMGDLTDQRQAALFLERIAKQERADFPESQRRALESLMRMDEEGCAVLKRLHESGAVRDPEAKLTLAYLAKQGSRRP
jgi:hypothetical protein